MIKALLATIFALFSVLAFALDEWIQTNYWKSDFTVGGGILTLNPEEAVEFGEFTWSINVTRYFMKESVIGEISEVPAWVPELTPLGYSNQSDQVVDTNCFAPNGFVVKNFWRATVNPKLFDSMKMGFRSGILSLELVTTTKSLMYTLLCTKKL